MLKRPTYLAIEIEKAAMELINTERKSTYPLRMITVTGINLVPENEEAFQLSLFEDTNEKSSEKQENLEKAIDKIREKYGETIIEKASVIQNDIGLFPYLDKN